MIMYRASMRSHRQIVSRRVIKATDKTVLIEAATYMCRDRREAIESRDHKWFKTRQAAKDWLVERSALRVKHCREAASE